MERRAYALAIYTGQRLTDLVGMARAHRKNGSIRVVQSKTGEEHGSPSTRNSLLSLGAASSGT